MTRPTLCLLLIAGLLSPAAWAADTVPAPSAGSWTPGQGTEGTKAPVAGTAAPAEASAAPAAATASAPAMATAPAPTASAAPAASTQAPAASAPVETPAAAPAAEPAPAMVAAPVAMSSYSGGSLPQRGMNMDNVEHIFGTPLQKQDAVGKPPISRWVYADYVVYFEYNMVLHTVMKSDAFTRTPGR